MSYIFHPDQIYRMPTHFGPSLGPRQGVDGRRYANTTAPDDTMYQATFKADKNQLEKLLPPGFSLREPYTLSMDFSFITNIEWLAGRGYNTFGLSTPVTYHGEQETVHGDLLFVLWENKADPIITGREELGFSKIYCEIPPPQIFGDTVICRASWDGFEFATFTLKGLVDCQPEDLPAEPETQPSAGTLHYKYIPKTGVPGQADAQYAVLTPGDWPNIKLDQMQKTDSASITFHPGSWEQLPTLVTIVNTLSELTLGECTQALMTKTRGGKDLSDQRILR